MEFAINEGKCFATVVEAEVEIKKQVEARPEYKPISEERVNLGPTRAYRRMFQHRNDQGQTEVIVRIDFLIGPDLYTVNGFMFPQDANQVAPIIDSIAAAVVPVQQPPRSCD
ncbi:MAG: hypothetical protein U0841_21385 [Chloroflexia bacterium]